MKLIKTTLLAATLLAAMATGVGAQEINLRLAHWVPAKHPIQPNGFEPWAKSMAEASGG